MSVIVSPEILKYIEQSPDQTSITQSFTEAEVRAHKLTDEKPESEIQTIVRGCGVPLRFLGANKADVSPSYWKQVYPVGEGLFLHGGAGTGKTHLAVAIIRETVVTPRATLMFDVSTHAWLVKKQKSPWFVSVPDLLMKIRSTFRQDSVESEEQVIDLLSAPKMLVLDDLGAEKTTDWSLQTLYTIIDRRYREVCPTIVTSNLDPQALSDKIGDRITSRLVGMCKVIALKGSDRRLKR